MPATTFPTYTYLAGAASVVPKEMAGQRPGLEGMVRDAILVGYTIAEHLELKPAYSEDGLSPQNDDALRVDAAIKRILNERDAALFAIARRKVSSALRHNDWNDFMRSEVSAAGMGRAGQYRTARGAPNLMTLAMASTAAAKLQIAAPRRDDPTDTNEAHSLQAANDTGQYALPGIDLDNTAPVPRRDSTPARPRSTTPAHRVAGQPDMFDMGKAA